MRTLSLLLLVPLAFAVPATPASADVCAGVLVGPSGDILTSEHCVPTSTPSYCYVANVFAANVRAYVCVPL